MDAICIQISSIRQDGGGAMWGEWQRAGRGWRGMEKKKVRERERGRGCFMLANEMQAKNIN